MSAKAAGIVIGTMYAAFFFIILVGAGRRRIANAYADWQLKSGRREQPRAATAGRDEEEGLPARRQQPPQPASRPLVPVRPGITISAPQLIHPETIAHSPMTPKIYLVPPPPQVQQSPPPPPWHPVVPRKPRTQLPQCPSVSRKPLPHKPQPMLPSPPPIPSPIPQHHRHLAPEPLRVGPYHGEFYQKPKLKPVKLSEILEGNEKNDDLLATQQNQQHDNDRDADDSSSGRTTYLSPGCILRNSAGSNSTSSTDSDTTPSQSPRMMEARARAVKLVSQTPDRQPLQVEIVMVGATPPKETKQLPQSTAQAAKPDECGLANAR